MQTETRIVTFVADHSPYMKGESASFDPKRAASYVRGGFAHYADDLVATALGRAAELEHGKRTGQAREIATK